VNQMLGTAAVESNFGYYQRQLGGGPALGIFQMETATRQDIVDNYLRYRPELRKRIEKNVGPVDCTDKEFLDSRELQIVFCYLHYDRYNAWGDSLEEYARNWKRVYNTELGKGTVDKFIEKYRRYIR
jgi:hypothetical protein